MTYKSAKHILPEDLVAMIQEFVEGQYLYIPKKEASRKSWGQVSGSKAITRRRNREMIALYHKGIGIEILAQKYHLAPSTIRKIIWKSDQDSESHS